MSDFDEPQEVFFHKCNFINAEMDHDLNQSGPIYSAFQYPITKELFKDGSGNPIYYVSKHLRKLYKLFDPSDPGLNSFKNKQIEDFKEKSRENVEGYCNKSYKSLTESDITPAKLNFDIQSFKNAKGTADQQIYESTLYEFFKDKGTTEPGLAESEEAKKRGRISEKQLANQPGLLISRIFPGLYPSDFWTEYLNLYDTTNNEISNKNGEIRFILAPFCQNQSNLDEFLKDQPKYIDFYSTYPSGGNTIQTKIRENLYDVLKKFSWGTALGDDEWRRWSTPVLTSHKENIPGLSEISRVKLSLFRMIYMQPIGVDSVSAQNNKNNWYWDIRDLFNYKTVKSKKLIGDFENHSTNQQDGNQNSEKDINIFLFIDTPNLYNHFSSLRGEALNYVRNKDYSVNIHIIHTVFSLADTADKTAPFHKSKYNPILNNKIRFFSWLYYPDDDDDKYRTTKIPINDPDQNIENKILDVGFNVRTSFAHNYVLHPKPSFSNMVQLWSPPTAKNPFKELPSINKIQDPRKTSNAGKIRDRLQILYNNWKNINSIKKEGTPYNDISEDIKKEIFLSAQQKKYGDYGQIYSAHQFPTLRTDELKKFKLVCGGTPNMQSDNPSPPIKDEEYLIDFYIEKSTTGDKPNAQWLRDRTFLVTGDWPCFAYTVYNKVNCLFHPPCGRGGKDCYKNEIGVRAVF